MQTRCTRCIERFCRPVSKCIYIYIYTGLYDVESNALAPVAAPKAAPPPDKGDPTKKFQEKLEKGILISVLLQDGNSLSCKVYLVHDPPSLRVSFQEKTRNIQFHEIKCLLYGGEALKRVETKAILTEDDRCVAIQLINGNCIPIKFSTSDDKKKFIEIVSQMTQGIVNASSIDESK
eukprot:Platyproteum_vivax@DN7451_c0_g1_i5.p1